MPPSTPAGRTAQSIAVLVTASALSIIAVAITRHEKPLRERTLTLSELYPWNVVQPDDL